MLESPVAPPNEWHTESEADAQIWKISKSPVPDVMQAALLKGLVMAHLRKLVRVLPHYRLRPFTAFAVYPSRRYLDAKVRTLLGHLRPALSSSLNDAIERIEALTRVDSQ